MALSGDYVERVYAGVLGKMIGVYLGRPFEGWTHQRILSELGEITGYVHDRLGMPLIVPDDDLSGTFTFVRALEDFGTGRHLTPAQVGDTWLNYIVPGRSILWWGGFGLSTEHTAFIRMQRGIRPPQSGSIALNGKVVAEQIGAQIFIDAWAMAAPGDPELAAELARRAASVSHDGEAVYAAQLLAAMEAQAFVEKDIHALIDVGLSLIPRDCTIARMIQEIREWAATTPDWRRARELLAAKYGYDQYPGNCHVVPNHGLIILGLLYGEDDFKRTLGIVNTCGWDTDCNSGNAGCLLGIKNGLAAIPDDWRAPVADRLYLPTADSGRVVTDAVRETYHIVNMGRALNGLAPHWPKGGARFHFEAPGSVQGFQPEPDTPEGGLRLENVAGKGAGGSRALALRYRDLGPGAPVRASSATFLPPDAPRTGAYALMASPALYPGQTVRLAVGADAANAAPVHCRPYVSVYEGDDVPRPRFGPGFDLEPGGRREWTWRVPDTGGLPIAAVGIELACVETNGAQEASTAQDTSSARETAGSVYLDYLTWSGTPTLVLRHPQAGGSMWRRAWVDGVDHWRARNNFWIAQDSGTGLLIHGTREWRDYRVEAEIKPYLLRSAGVAAYVQGMRRYYALVLTGDGRARLVKRRDEENRVLAEADFAWQQAETYSLALTVRQSANGVVLQGAVGGRELLSFEDSDSPFDGGGIALVCEEGCFSTDEVRVRPAETLQ